MSNSVVQKIRERFPTLQATDAEITLAIYDATRANPVFDADKEFVNQALDYKVALGSSRPGTEFGRSFKSGVDVAQAKLYDTLALAGETTGLEKLKEIGDEGYSRNIAEAQENAPTIPNISDVRGPAELGRYALGLVGSQAPQLGGTLAASAAGGLVGGAVAGPPGVVAGALMGAGAAGFTQMQSFGEISRQPGVDRSQVVPASIGVGVLGAVLEALVALKVTNAFLRVVPNAVAKQYLARVLTKVPANALAEGGTEVAQEVVAMAGELYANRANPKFSLTDAEIRNRLVNAGAAGVLLGGATGPVEAIAKPDEPTETPTAAAQTPTGSPPAPTPVPQTPTATQREPDETEVDYGAGGEMPAFSQFVTRPTDAVSQFIGTRDATAAAAMAKVVAEDIISGASREQTYIGQDRQYYRQVRGQIESEVQDAASQGIGREDALSKYLGAGPQLPADGTNREQQTEVSQESAGAGDSDRLQNVTGEQAVTSVGPSVPVEPWQTRKSEADPYIEQNWINAVRTDDGKVFVKNVEHGDLMSFLEDEGHSFTNPNARGWVLVGRKPSETYIGVADLEPAGGDFHKAYILKAIREGKTVPEEVLSDYPDLALPQVSQESAEDGSGDRLPDGAGEQAAVTAVVPEPESVNITQAEDAIAELIRRQGELPDADYTPEGLERILGEGGIGVYEMVGLITKTPDGFYRFSDSIISKATPKAAQVTSVTDAPRSAAVEVALQPAEVEKVIQETEETTTPTPTPAPAAPATPVLEPEVHPVVYEIDFAGRVLAGHEETSARGVKEGEAKQLQHAFFEVTDTEYSPELGERLTNESRSNKEGALNTETHRITFFENQETGAVVGLPTYYTKSSERGAHYRVAPLPGESKGTTIEKLMEDGLWIPVASVRTEEPKYALDQKNVFQFEDFRDFERRFLNGARQRAADARSTVEEVERSMQAKVINFETGEEVEVENEGAIEEESNPMLELADIIIEYMPKVKGKIPTDLTLRDFETILANAGQDAENNRAIRFGLSEAAKQRLEDKDFLLKSQNDQRITLARDLARALHERYEAAVKAGQFEVSELRLYLGPAEGESGIGAGWSSAQRTADTQRFNLSAKESGPVVTAEFMATAKALADAGVPVNIFKQVAGALIQEVSSIPNLLARLKAERLSLLAEIRSDEEASAITDAEAERRNALELAGQVPFEASSPQNYRRLNELNGLIADLERQSSFIDAEGRITGAVVGGVYDRTTKMVALVLGDPANPKQSNLETLFEEAGHALFDRELPEVRDLILRAIGRLTNDQLGLTKQQWENIRNAYPDGTTPDVLHEERLMAVISANLVREGFNPTQARGIVGAVMRFVKDLYLRGLMAIQRMVLGRQYDNPEIAQRYFQNRLESFLALDSASLPGFIQRLGGGRPLAAREVRVYLPASGSRWTVERYNYDADAIEYEDVLQDTVEAVMLNARNALRFSVPAPSNPDQFRDPAIRLNTQAAVNNWLRDLQNTVAAKASVAIDVVRRTFGLTDTTAVRRNLERQAQGVDGFKPDQKIGDFQQEWNRKAALQDAWNNTSKQANKIGAQQADAESEIERLKGRKDRLIQRHAEDIKNYTDADGLTSEMVFAVQDLTRETMREFLRGSRRLGRIEQQIAALEGQIGKPIPREYGTALRKLFTGDQLSGEKLFSFLERLANDPLIDPTKGINAIRGDIRQSHASNPNEDYARLLDTSREGRALLATVVAFAKAHQVLMTKLALRKSTNLEARAELNEELARLKTQSLTDIIQGIKSVARVATVEERARLQYRKAQLEIRKVDKGIKRMEAKADLAKKAIPEYLKALRDLEAKLELSANFIIHDGARVLVPPSPDATHEQLMESPRQVLRLSTANSTPTNPDMVDEWLKKMTLFMAEREGRAQNGDTTALDSDYQFIKRQFTELMGWKFEPFLLASDHAATGLALSSSALQMESFGTPASRMVAQMVRIFEATKARLNAIGTRLGIANVHAENQVLKVLADGRKNGFRRDFYRETILYPAIGFLENRNRSFTEEFTGTDEQLRAALMQRLENYLLSNDAVRPWIADRVQDFMAALADHIQALVRANQAFQSEIDEAGLGVKDPKLNNQIRRAFAVGPITVSRTINSHVLKPMVTALDNSGWAPDPNNDGKSLAAEDFKRVAALYNGGRRDELDALLRKYFNHPEFGNTVDRFFVRELANMPDNSPFDAPLLEDGETRPPANPVLVAEAYTNANRNILSFIEAIYDLHEGTGNKGQFIQDTLERMADIYFEARTIKNKIDPDPDAKVTTLRGMVPGVMIDARLIEHLPDLWFRYHSFDPMDNTHVAERIAGQIAFGRDQERLAEQFSAVAGEVKTAIERLKLAEAEAKFETPTTSRKELEKRIKQKAGGDSEWKRLSTISARAGLLSKFRDGLVTYFRNRNDPVGNVHYATRIAQTLAGAAVNQISSALAQLSTLFDMNLRYGASPTILKATVKNIFLAGKDLAGSLAQAIGWEVWKNSYFEDAYQRLGFNDPESARRFGDLIAPLEGEDRFISGLRRIRDVQTTALNPRGEQARFTAFRPLAPFFSSVLSANKAVTISTWSLAKNYVTKGLEYLRTHPELDGARFKLTPENLGLSGLEKDSFLRFQQDLNRYGLDFNAMVQGAKDRQATDKTILTDKEMARMYSMALNEVSLENNIATMPIAAFNNSVLRFILPLLGWSYRRALQISSLRLDTSGKNSLAALSKGLVGLAAVSTGALGLSALIDDYQERILGKARNLRKLRGIPDTGQDWLAIVERLGRMGTMGLFGELANGAVNVGTGQGDNRGLSVDQRVLALSNFQSLIRAVSSWINQDFTVDYSHVVRPFLTSVGGNGLLQYMQLVNRAFGLDNQEARVTARINAANYLRVAGRELGLSIRAGQGGYGTPTPMTPFIANMEFAAYANDPLDFRRYYNLAVAEAREAKKEDPEDYVKRSFESRHPLRFVFQTVPSEEEYRKILATLSDDGRQDVATAVRLFNFYAGKLNIKPMEGRKKKVNTRTARERAVTLAF